MTYRKFYQTQAQIARQLNKEESAVKTLILEICNLSPNDYYLIYDEEISTIDQNKILESLDLYFYKNQPIQYILGYTYFYGLKLMVNKNVLIPRQETELLVEIVLKIISDDNIRIIDVGCGSGAIALALKKALPKSYITAIDVSREALQIAKLNANINHLNIEFIESDLFLNVNNKYDVLVSNPPYIPFAEDVEALVKDNEPHTALFASRDGLYFYEEILKASWKILNEKNIIFFEIPYNKDIDLMNLSKLYYPNAQTEILKDLNNKSRILVIRNYWR